MNFCPMCAGALKPKFIEEDQRLRLVCSDCDAIQYQNPKLVVGTIPQWEDKILLCKRNIEPAFGLWTLPAGYMELGETTVAGATRETLEETGAVVKNLRPYSLIDLPEIGQIYFIFISQLSSLDFHPTTESSDVKLFDLEDVPWESIAFSVIKEILLQYQQDSKTQSFPFRIKSLP